jgi:single-strand DNA-binding protein
MAEVVSTYMMKGSQMQIEGRLQTRSWDGKNGKQYRTEIIAESIQFGNKPRNRNRRDDLESIDIDEGQPADSAPSSEELPF